MHLDKMVREFIHYDFRGYQSVWVLIAFNILGLIIDPIRPEIGNYLDRMHSGE